MSTTNTSKILEPATAKPLKRKAASPALNSETSMPKLTETIDSSAAKASTSATINGALKSKAADQKPAKKATTTGENSAVSMAAGSSSGREDSPKEQATNSIAATASNAEADAIVSAPNLKVTTAHLAENAGPSIINTPNPTTDTKSSNTTPHSYLIDPHAPKSADWYNTSGLRKTLAPFRDDSMTSAPPVEPTVLSLSKALSLIFNHRTPYDFTCKHKEFNAPSPKAAPLMSLSAESPDGRSFIVNPAGVSRFALHVRTSRPGNNWTPACYYQAGYCRARGGGKDHLTEQQEDAVMARVHTEIRPFIGGFVISDANVRFMPSTNSRIFTALGEHLELTLKIWNGPAILVVGNKIGFYQFQVRTLGRFFYYWSFDCLGKKMNQAIRAGIEICEANNSLLDMLFEEIATRSTQGLGDVMSWIWQTAYVKLMPKPPKGAKKDDANTVEDETPASEAEDADPSSASSTSPADSSTGSSGSSSATSLERNDPPKRGVKRKGVSIVDQSPRMRAKPSGQRPILDPDFLAARVKSRGEMRRSSRLATPAVSAAPVAPAASRKTKATEEVERVVSGVGGGKRSKSTPA